jgi:hypothetical protein
MPQRGQLPKGPDRAHSVRLAGTCSNQLTCSGPSVVSDYTGPTAAAACIDSLHLRFRCCPSVAEALHLPVNTVLAPPHRNEEIGVSSSENLLKDCGGPFLLQLFIRTCIVHHPLKLSTETMQFKALFATLAVIGSKLITTCW